MLKLIWAFAVEKILKVSKSHELAQQIQSEIFLIACVIRKVSEESAKNAV